MANRFRITQSREEIIATGGIAMVGALLNDNRGLASVDKMTTDRIKKGWISNSGIIKSVVGLFTLARTDFADIAMFRDELSFRLALELERVPSEETLRQRLDLIAKLNSRQTLLDYAMRDLLDPVIGNADPHALPMASFCSWGSWAPAGRSTPRGVRIPAFA
mgnify:CR=1 FL=1